MTAPLCTWWPRMVVALSLLLLGAGGLSGCASGRNIVVGRITPEHFEFTTVVEEEPGEPSGWRAVCIHARITQGDSEATTACKFEVGLPLCTRQKGRISLEEDMTRETYKALTEPLLITAVGPDGAKRPIHAFPKVLGTSVLAVSGLEALRLHLPYFLGQRRGADRADPEFGSSLHALFDTKDERQASEIVRRVAQDEIPRRFGKYLDALHAFNVTVHHETRTMVVAMELVPHGAERVSWSFELLLSPAEEHRPSSLLSSHQEMDDPRAAELSRIARHYYPTGFPPWEDDHEEPVPAHQRTPEHQRWEAAWEQALRGKQWKSLMDGLRAAFPGINLGSLTPAYHTACRFCLLYLEKPLPDGDQLVTRVAGAISILAPLYLVYTTTQLVRPDQTSAQPRLSFEVEPTSEARSYADKMAHHIERAFGYQPFPLNVADVPLADLRVCYLNEQPTLLGALLDSKGNLANLP